MTFCRNCKGGLTLEVMISKVSPPNSNQAGISMLSVAPRNTKLILTFLEILNRFM